MFWKPIARPCAFKKRGPPLIVALFVKKDTKRELLRHFYPLFDPIHQTKLSDYKLIKKISKNVSEGLDKTDKTPPLYIVSTSFFSAFSFFRFRPCFFPETRYNIHQDPIPSHNATILTSTRRNHARKTDAETSKGKAQQEHDSAYAGVPPGPHCRNMSQPNDKR